MVLRDVPLDLVVKHLVNIVAPLHLARQELSSRESTPLFSQQRVQTTGEQPSLVPTGGQGSSRPIGGTGSAPLPLGNTGGFPVLDEPIGFGSSSGEDFQGGSGISVSFSVGQSNVIASSGPSTFPRRVVKDQITPTDTQTIDVFTPLTDTFKYRRRYAHAVLTGKCQRTY